MVKRPLVWMLCAYLVGMYLAWQGAVYSVLFILIWLLGLVIYVFMFRVKNTFINVHDKFLWCLPLLILIGFFALKDQTAEPMLSKAFDQKVICELTGNINMIVKKQWGKALYLKNNSVFLPTGEEYLCENVIVFCYDEQGSGKKPQESLTRNYRIGNLITVHGTLRKFSTPGNPGQFNEKLYYRIENIDYKMEADSISVKNAGYSKFHLQLDRLKDKLLAVYQGILSDKEAGTVIAMLLGDKYLLDDEIKQLYQVNGISHILAISGLHVSLLGMFMFWLLKKIKIPILPATLLTIFFIYCYGVLTNFSVSTNRAVVMMTVMLLSGLFGKTYDMLSSLALSALIILFQNPLQILSAGFLLSFGAVLGIAVIYPCLQKIFPTKHPILSSLYISISAQITTTPFVAYFFYQFPTYSILTNLIILPFITVLTLNSLFAGIAGAICKPLGMFLIGGSNYILKFNEEVCRIGNKLPGNLIATGKPELLHILIYIVLIMVFIRCVQRYDKKWMVLIPVAALILFLIPGRSKGLDITMLDVGQGDAIYIESKNKTTYLIDGGSSDVVKVGINRIQPFLLSQGTDCLDYAIMSHSDKDHVSGLEELIEAGRIKINTLVLPAISNKDESYLTLETLARSRKIAILYISTGDYIMDGDMHIFCLHPIVGDAAESANAYSTVLSVTYGKFDMLFTGDLQQDGEEEVVRLLKDKTIWKEYFKGNAEEFALISDYDVLKVAHHGSKYSTMIEFLRLIRPEISLISCGKDNFYGHPHKELLTRLKDMNSKILITYETGAISIKTDGKMMTVREYKNE